MIVYSSGFFICFKPLVALFSPLTVIETFGEFLISNMVRFSRFSGLRVVPYSLIR